MIVVAIIGILASVALPAYRDYLVRAKVSEVILAASAPKGLIAEAAATLGGMPSTASAAISSQTSRYVLSVRYTSTAPTTGVITATADGDDNIVGLDDRPDRNLRQRDRRDPMDLRRLDSGALSPVELQVTVALRARIAPR